MATAQYVKHRLAKSTKHIKLNKFYQQKDNSLFLSQKLMESFAQHQC